MLKYKYYPTANVRNPPDTDMVETVVASVIEEDYDVEPRIDFSGEDEELEVQIHCKLSDSDTALLDSNLANLGLVRAD